MWINDFFSVGDKIPQEVGDRIYRFENVTLLKSIFDYAANTNITILDIDYRLGKVAIWLRREDGNTYLDSVIKLLVTGLIKE